MFLSRHESKTRNRRASYPGYVALRLDNRPKARALHFATGQEGHDNARKLHGKKRLELLASNRSHSPKTLQKKKSYLGKQEQQHVSSLCSAWSGMLSPIDST